MPKFHVEVKAQWVVEADTGEEAIKIIKKKVRLSSPHTVPEWYFEDINDPTPSITGFMA